jgi:hypothetical protein
MERSDNRDLTATPQADGGKQTVVSSADSLRGGLKMKVSLVDLIIFLLLALFGGDRNDKTPRG